MSVEEQLAEAVEQRRLVEDKLKQLLVARRASDAVETSLKRELEAVKRELAESSQAFDDLMKTSSAQEEMLDSEIADLKKELAAKKIALEQATKSYQTSTAQMAELQRELAKAENAAIAQKKRVLELELQVDGLESRERRHEGAYERLTEEYNRSLQNVAFLGAQLEEMKELLQRAKIEAEEKPAPVAVVAAPVEKEHSNGWMYFGTMAILGFIGYTLISRKLHQ